MFSPKKILSNMQKNIVKNAPTILSIMGNIGVLASVGLAIDGTVNVKKDLAEADDISNADKAAIYIKAYMPTILMVTATEICIYGSNQLNQKRIATLAGAYILSEANFKDYKEKAEEFLGEKKFSELNNQIVQKQVDENPQTESNTCMTNLPNATQLGLWYDCNSKRYFYSNAEYIRRAELQANEMLQKDNKVSINDIYEMLGIETIPLGEQQGWYKTETHNAEVIISMDSALMGPDIPVGTIEMDVVPISTWFSEL